jgi:NAD(P)H-hydrate epimerase
MLATSDQMREFDRIAIERYAIPGLLLMENAGRAFVDELENRVGDLASKSVVVVCGKGNNGGDGFVIARHLLNRGASVHVVLLCKRREVRGDAKTSLDVLYKMIAGHSDALRVAEVSSARGLGRLPTSDIVIDAIFGTGFSGRVKGLPHRAIEWVNKQRGYVAAVDIPSGVTVSTGIVENLAVKAHLTVTMGLAKIGQYVGSGREHSSDVAVADIGMPRVVLQPSRRQVYRVLGADVAGSLPKRPLTAHKYSVGKIFVLAGSRGLTGAPYMTSQAAMRSGAGGVVLGVPKSIYAPLIRKLTEVMLTPLEETAEGTVALASIDTINERIEWADVVVIGPGLSRNVETRKLVLRLVPTILRPLVIDADGLNCVAEDISVLRRRKHKTILTPHVGELSRLIRRHGEEIELNRVPVAAEAADVLNSIVVLKGSPTVTGTPSGPTYLNSTGNPGMATAGSGDVLTGIIAGLLGQGMTAESAAYAGAFIHGLAGDISAQKVGERSLMALDILNRIPEAIKSLET